MQKNNIFIILLITFIVIDGSLAIWCYRCNSATPGCSDNFNWRGIGFLGEQCPEDDDVCVKMIEKKGAREYITRDCLSALRPYRRDIPADKYEGCRPGTYDPKLANYVNNSVREIDVQRKYFDTTTYCFCFLDHRCNGSANLKISSALVIAITGLVLALYRN